MDAPEPLHLSVRRRWDGAAVICLVGPGGAGKSTLGRLLAPRLRRTLVDLDESFLRRIGDIGAFIRDRGYPAYKLANADLATTLADEAGGPTLLVTSSGFLSDDNPPEALAANRALLARSYSVSLLPSLEVESAVATLAARQLKRPFNAGLAREAATARDRFETYRAAGDLLVCSAAPPQAVAEAVTPYLAG